MNLFCWSKHKTKVITKKTWKPDFSSECVFHTSLKLSTTYYEITKTACIPEFVYQATCISGFWTACIQRLLVPITKTACISGSECSDSTEWSIEKVFG